MHGTSTHTCFWVVDFLLLGPKNVHTTAGRCKGVSEWRVEPAGDGLSRLESCSSPGGTADGCSASLRPALGRFVALLWSTNVHSIPVKVHSVLKHLKWMILINAQSVSESQLSGQEENICHGY